MPSELILIELKVLGSGCRQERSANRVRSLCAFSFRGSLGHFLVAFSDASITFFSVFFVAKLLLPDSFCGKVIGVLAPNDCQRDGNMRAWAPSMVTRMSTVVMVVRQPFSSLTTPDVDHAPGNITANGELFSTL